MARKPQMQVAGAIPSTNDMSKAIASLDNSWTPTVDQRRAKAKLSVALRDDPLLVSSSLSGPIAASVTGVRTVEHWWGDLKFREWFTDQYESAAKAEFLFDNWLDEIALRMPNMADKDLLTAGKLLSDLARKMPEKFAKERVLDAGIGNMAPDQLRAFIVSSAQAIGLRLIESEGEK